jgi:DNA-directed RNA polymerase specialized sigma24 family protein
VPHDREGAGRAAAIYQPEKAMSDRTLLIDGVSLPRFLCGTARKEDRTQGLTELALRQGFRGLDTANQRKHYHEAAVGQAVAVRHLCAGLDETDRRMLELRLHDRSTAEIAAALGLSAVVLRVRLTRLRQRLAC